MLLGTLSKQEFKSKSLFELFNSSEGLNYYGSLVLNNTELKYLDQLLPSKSTPISSVEKKNIQKVLRKVADTFAEITELVPRRNQVGSAPLDLWQTASRFLRYQPEFRNLPTAWQWRLLH